MRNDGFYWVKLNGNWTIAEYTCKMWFVIYSDMEFGDSDFEQIGNEIVTPIEYKNS